MTDLEPITVHSERLNVPHTAHPSEIIAWLQSISAKHQPTNELPAPRVTVDQLGILATWTTKDA